MAGEWYYARESASVGPMTWVELKDLADSGELQRTDLVWTAPMDEWEEAGGFEELFAPESEPLISSPPAGSSAPPDSGQSGHEYEDERWQDEDESRERGAAYYAHRSQGVPPMVLTGFIISCAGVVICAPIAIVGAVICLIGLPEAKRRQEGKGLAIAGIVIGVAAFLFAILGFIVFFAVSAGELAI